MYIYAIATTTLLPPLSFIQTQCKVSSKNNQKILSVCENCLGQNQYFVLYMYAMIYIYIQCKKIWYQKRKCNQKKIARKKYISKKKYFQEPTSYGTNFFSSAKKIKLRKMWILNSNQKSVWQAVNSPFHCPLKERKIWAHHVKRCSP